MNGGDLVNDPLSYCSAHIIIVEHAQVVGGCPLVMHLHSYMVWLQMVSALHMNSCGGQFAHLLVGCADETIN